jgi:hypothetical protein
MKEEVMVVMLPTQETKFGGIIQRIPYYEGEDFAPRLTLNLSPTLLVKELLYLIPQHLYFTTDEEIKEGDWFYNVNYKKVLPWEKSFHQHIGTKKIIATTDTKLGIKCDCAIKCDLCTGEHVFPQPSQAFIEKYVKQGGIDKVDVEYGEDCERHNELEGAPVIEKWSWLKINDDNTITIHSIKDSWNREEVEYLLFKYAEDEHAWFSTKGETDEFNKWVKENL